MNINFLPIKRIATSIMVSFMFFLLSGCDVKDDNFYNSQTSTYQISMLSVHDHLSSAIALAQKWHTDAYLLNVSIDVLVPNANSSKNDISFVFRSPSNENKELLVRCSDNCYLKEFSSSLSLPECFHLEINDSMIDSEQALNLALKHGGDEHIDDKNMLVNLYLERYPPCRGEKTAWRVDFKNIVTFEDARFIFDATTGELLEMK